MALLVLAYPELPQGDLDWIQNIRAEHDTLYYDVIGAHFTIVFPVVNVEPTVLVNHVQRSVKDIAPFRFVLRCAVINKDAFNEYTHVFLVPDEGYSEIVKLHDRLYSDILLDELRLDLPFIPHTGVANAVDPEQCKSLADLIPKTSRYSAS